MSKGIRREDIVHGVVKGMAKAATQWYDMSGEWANDAPEHWFSATVARELDAVLDAEKCSIDMEFNTKKIRQLAKHGMLGRPKKSTREPGRVDVVVFRQNERPVAAIEIKTPVWSWNTGLTKDVERLRDLVAGGGNHLKLGCLAIYTDAGNHGRMDPGERIESLFAKTKKKARSICPPGLFVSSFDLIKKDPDKEDRWGVQCIAITSSQLGKVSDKIRLSGWRDA